MTPESSEGNGGGLRDFVVPQWRSWLEVALGAVIGGAFGNVLDRLRFGAVVDFVDAHAWGWHWYVFNVADAAIVCGVGVLLLDALLPPRQAPKDSV